MSWFLAAHIFYEDSEPSLKLHHFIKLSPIYYRLPVEHQRLPLRRQRKNQGTRRKRLHRRLLLPLSQEQQQPPQGIDSCNEFLFYSQRV